MRAKLSAAPVRPLPRPEINFDSSTVVVVSAGSTGAGHSIGIDSARMSGTHLEIYVRETMVEHCMSDLRMRYPAHAVRGRRPAGAVRFVNDCTIARYPRR